MTYEDRIKSGDIIIPKFEKDIRDPNKIPLMDDNCTIIGFRDLRPGEKPRTITI